MSLLFSMLMKMEAGQAKAELRALQGELSKGKAEVAGLGKAAAVADGQIEGLADASGKAAAANDRVAQSQTRVQATAGTAAGSVGNLVANFNDVGMMMAAGQSPLQLAIQQGSQITQVIGPMGAAGAAKALGSAFGAMLSPINLVTYGVIAFGAMAVQWLMDSEGSAKTFSAAIDDLDGAISDLQQHSKRDAGTLREDFGELTAQVVTMETALGRLATVKAFQAQREAIVALKAETEGAWFAMFTGDRFTQGGQIADILGTDWLERGKLVATSEVAEFRTALESLDTIKGPRAQLEVFRSLQEQMLSSTGGIDQMTIGQLAFYDALVSSEQKARQLLQAQIDTARAAEEAARAAGSDNGRMGGPMAQDLQAPEANVSADLGTAQELLATLEQQASVQDLINQFGRESESVALARLEAERAAFEEMVQGMDIAEGLKLELIDAWAAANGLASARIAAMIEAALGPASALNGLLKSAAGWWANIQSNMAIARFNRKSAAGSMEYGGRGGDPRDFMPGGSQSYSDNAHPFVYGGPSLDAFNNPKGGGSGRKGGGGAKSAREERDAVEELIQKLRQEQEVLQETDPVKREMLKYRKQLAEATDAQRAEVEGLIRAENKLKAVQSAREYAADNMADFLDGIIKKGGEASDVLDGLISQFASMAVRSVITGNGWFAELIGMTGGIFGKAKPFATGGMIYGAGGPTDDKVPIWASAGEFMMNARAAARYRPVLERMNAGDGIPGFANGGSIGGAGASAARNFADQSAARGSGSVIQLQPVLVNNTSRPVEMQVEETTDARGQRQQRYVISEAVGDGLVTPGGKAQRNLQQAYGVGRGVRRRS